MFAQSTLYWRLNNAAVMSQRTMRHIIRNLDTLITSIILPVIILLMFVFVFGGAINTGTEYINYVVPGILLLCAGFGSSSTAVAICTDMLGGIIDRFRSLPIASSSVLTGHVVASLVRNLISTTVVVLVAVVIGFRPTAGPLAWLAALGILMLFVLAISWLSVVLGLIANSTDAASGFSFFMMFLPYISSAFVPTDTMPRFLHVFAEHQPVTPVIETLRGLLLGTPIGNSAWLAIAWCGGIALVSFAAARAIFNRRALS
jgi:ABC-2 type transport system permease protein